MDFFKKTQICKKKPRTKHPLDRGCKIGAGWKISCRVLKHIAKILRIILELAKVLIQN
jgi:hypothetical protein